jgi:hypothetical protein
MAAKLEEFLANADPKMIPKIMKDVRGKSQEKTEIRTMLLDALSTLAVTAAPLL